MLLQGPAQPALAELCACASVLWGGLFCSALGRWLSSPVLCGWVWRVEVRVVGPPRARHTGGSHRPAPSWMLVPCRQSQHLTGAWTDTFGCTESVFLLEARDAWSAPVHVSRNPDVGESAGLFYVGVRILIYKASCQPGFFPAFKLLKDSCVCIASSHP